MKFCSKYLLAGGIGVLSIFATPSIQALAQDAEEEHLDVGEVILDHVKDSHMWHLWEGHSGTVFLPVIVYTEEKGLDMFSSRNLFDEHHMPVEYNGYIHKDYRIRLASTGAEVWDFSITKNVVMLFLNALVMLLVFFGVARGMKKNKGRAPRGIQSLLEPVVIFVREDIVAPNIGKGYEKYLPYMLTLFFFVLFGNLLGLLPGAGNLTGNIAVTMSLALLTFVITNVSGKSTYWSHIFWTPGVPFVLRPIIFVVELIGMFTKPFALMIRLFAAITAGHIVILSLLCMAFLFKSYIVGAGASLFVVLISLIELLVAAIQAYVFTLFSSLYIGMAIESGHEHETA